MNFLAFLFGVCISGFTLVPYNGTDYCVANDYYKVNGVRTPMGMTEVEVLLDKTGMSLPSVGLVDAIWRNAKIKLKPQPLHYLTDYHIHDTIVNKQLSELGNPKGLVAGHKKDIIQQPKGSPRVYIYGWHRLNGRPIQPPSKVHPREYYDYSHGIRLVYKLKEY